MGEHIFLEMLMALGQKGPRDVTEIEGILNLRLIFEGVLYSPSAAAGVVKGISDLMKYPPGLRSMLDSRLVYDSE